MTEHVEHTETRHTQATAPLIYCYAGQTDDVRKFLVAVGIGNPLSVVSTAEQLRGKEHFAFFHVKDHLEAVHGELWAMLADRGAVVVEIDNSRVRVNGSPQ